MERIISADSHVTILHRDVLERLPAKHHDAYWEGKLRALRRFVGPEVTHVPDDDQVGLDADHKETWSAAGRKGAFDPYERLKDMDTDQVDVEILYTDSWAGAAFYEMPDGAYLDGFRAFNTAAIDFASVDPKRLLPVYIVPIVDIEEAVAEVHRVASENARAVHLPLYPTDLGLPGYWDRRYDPLWAALQEARIPISQHVASNANIARIRAEDPTPMRGVMHTLPSIFMAEPIAFWLVAGMLDRFPDLRVVFVEAGLGWLPYFLERLDRVQERHGWRQFEGAIQEPPSFYWHRQGLATFEEDVLGVELRHRIGVENLMWATDYPHPDSTWPHSQQVIDTHFHEVPIEEARLMIGGNAARTYGL
ncbi:MAG TPA: amidohydrolase family protein [Acidimicrobiia bacterium]|nr:amidohydrolase family protein [Acidimicrobiia bacterium]